MGKHRFDVSASTLLFWSSPPCFLSNFSVFCPIQPTWDLCFPSSIWLSAARLIIAFNVERFHCFSRMVSYDSLIWWIIISLMITNEDGNEGSQIKNYRGVYSLPGECLYSSFRCNHACLSSSVRGGCQRVAGGREVVDLCILILCPVNSLSLCTVCNVYNLPAPPDSDNFDISTGCSVYCTTHCALYSAVCSPTQICSLVKHSTWMYQNWLSAQKAVHYVETQFIMLKYSVIE